MRLLIVLSLLFVSACSYKPIIDTGGRSGTFSVDRANKITDDTNLCHQEITKACQLCRKCMALGLVFRIRN